MAEDVTYQGSKHFPSNTRLRQLYGLALTQGGSAERAVTVLEALRDDLGVAFDDESGSLLARCYKDTAQRQLDREQRISSLRKAHDVYRMIYERSGKTSYYNGINTATMALLLGSEVEAKAVAAEVVEICQRERASWGDETPSGAYWLLATLGEASLIAGSTEDAVTYYALAIASAPGNFSKVSSTKRQLSLLLEYVDIDDDVLREAGARSASLQRLGSQGALLQRQSSQGMLLQRQSSQGMLLQRQSSQGTLQRQGSQGLIDLGARRPSYAAIHAGDDARIAALSSAARLSRRLGHFDRIFSLPRVAVFMTAEMHEGVIPAPGAQAIMAAQFDALLLKVHAHFGYASLCTVADIVFLEAVKRRGGEVYVVLPAPLDVHLAACATKFASIEQLTGERAGPFGTDYAATPPQSPVVAAACQGLKVTEPPGSSKFTPEGAVVVSNETGTVE